MGRRGGAGAQLTVACSLCLLILAPNWLLLKLALAEDSGNGEGQGNEAKSEKVLGRVLELESQLNENLVHPPPPAPPKVHSSNRPKELPRNTSLWIGVAEFQERDPARLKAEELLQSLREKAQEETASSKEKQTECTCFRVKHPMFSRHVCSCTSMCWTGQEFVPIGELTCKESTASPHEGAFLEPAPCSDFQEAFTNALEAIDWYRPTPDSVKESSRPNDWLHSRPNLNWRSGATFLQIMGEDGSNPFHYAARASTILLVNDPTMQGFLPRALRFMFPRHPKTLEGFRLLGARSLSTALTTVYLQRTMMETLKVSLHGSEQWRSHHLLGDVPMGYELIEFDNAWRNSTEEAPLCFETVILASPLKNQLYPGGRTQAMAIHQHLATLIGAKVPPEPTREGPIRVLYITRLLGPYVHRRALDLESHQALLDLMKERQYQVTAASPTDMSLDKLLTESQNADIVISLHGAAMTNPAALSRPDVVIVELMPYKTEQTTYRFCSYTSSQIYFMKKLNKGPPQDDPEEFDSLTVSECNSRMDCMLHYTHSRKVAITPDDVEELKTIFDVADSIVTKRRSLPLSTSLVKVISEDQPAEWKSPTGSTVACKGLKLPCTKDFLSVKGPKSFYYCCINKDSD